MLRGRRGGPLNDGRLVVVDGSGLDLAQLEPLHDAVDPGGVLGADKHIYHAVLYLAFAFQRAVDHTISFGLDGKLFQMLRLDGEHGQLLAAFQHGREALVAFALILIPVLPYQIDGGGDILRRGAGQLQHDLGPLQAHTNDLFRRVA